VARTRNACIAACVALSAWMAGNVAAPTQKLAPGRALPADTGGVGPGNIVIAPGRAGGPIMQEGPGGVPLSLGSSTETSVPLRHLRHRNHTRHVPPGHHP
jgi:hypothetical protein